jgi:hypothetical protein
MMHTVVSMTWVWQELSDEGIPRRALELLKNLMASAETGLLRGAQCAAATALSACAFAITRWMNGCLALR